MDSSHGLRFESMIKLAERKPKLPRACRSSQDDCKRVAVKASRILGRISESNIMGAFLCPLKAELNLEIDKAQSSRRAKKLGCSFIFLRFVQWPNSSMRSDGSYLMHI